MNRSLLTQLREQHQTSQQQLADLLNVSRPTYVLIESGKRDITVAQVQKLCAFFEISVAAFLQGKLQPEAEVHLEHSVTQPHQDPIRISVPQEKVTIFKEVLLYILNQVGGKPNVGQTVLYKLLYFIDFDFYEKYEKQLIGAKYIRNHYGPTPVEFAKIISDMAANKEIEQVASDHFSFPQTKYLPLRAPDLSVISGLEKEHIDFELARLSDLSAKELSTLSHKDTPWITAQQGEVLDYETVFYRTAVTSQRAYDNAEV